MQAQQLASWSRSRIRIGIEQHHVRFLRVAVVVHRSTDKLIQLVSVSGKACCRVTPSKLMLEAVGDDRHVIQSISPIGGVLDEQKAAAG